MLFPVCLTGAKSFTETTFRTFPALSNHYYRRDGVEVRAHLSLLMNLGLISLVESCQKALKTVFTASLVGAQHKRKSVENKPAISLAWCNRMLACLLVTGGRLNGMSLSLCGRLVAGTGNLAVVVTQSNRRLAKRANEKLIIRELSPKRNIVTIRRRRRKRIKFNKISHKAAFKYFNEV